MDPSQRFAYLFHRYFDKTCTQQEKNDLFEMLRHAEHDEALRRVIDETWKYGRPAYHQKDEKALTILQHIVKQQPAVIRNTTSKRIYLRYITVAAVLLMVVLVSFLSYRFTHSSSPVAVTPYSKPVADRFLTLSDGSKVLLHKGAHIAYQPEFTGTKREVYLTGEAYFDIRHDKRPFIVHTGNIKTTVLGTAFDINALDRNITVTVTKGKVKVENDHGEFSILKRNEQITVDVMHSSLKKKAVDANEIIAWKKPYLLFNDVSMSEAVQELQQRFHVHITLVNPALGSCNVTATFLREEPLEQIINVLSKINNMEYKIISPTDIDLSGEGCK